MNKLWIFILLSLFACNQNKEMKSFVVELPNTSKTHRPDIFYENKNKLCDELNLQRLEIGSDSFELRVWAHIEVVTGGQVLIIKKINHRWCCLNYHYVETQTGYTPLEYRVDTIWIKKEQPKSNWLNFFAEIANEKIYALPSQEDISGFKSEVTDGITYCVEFANTERYRFYWYNCPEVYSNRYADCKHMANIINIFIKEGFSITTLKDLRN